VSRHIPDTGISIGIYRIKRQSDKYIVITDIELLCASTQTDNHGRCTGANARWVGAGYILCPIEPAKSSSFAS